MEPQTNILTIDVEDYFQVHAFSNVVSYEDWPSFEVRAEQNTRKILSILEQHGVKATFFVLGWIAERIPELVNEIDDQGHEVASHGYQHQHISRQTPEAFRDDIREAKTILEKIIKKPVYGYRAPTYSITEKNLWALKILAEEGYQYDSSIFPIKHDFYGIPDAPRCSFKINFNKKDPSRLKDFHIEPFRRPSEFEISYDPQEIVEIPISTMRFLGYNFPLAGGGYFRLLPYQIVKAGLKRINQEGNPFIFYLHPWEVDPEQPRVKGIAWKSRLRHYLNLDKTESRFRQLLSDFSFTSVSSIFPLS